MRNGKIENAKELVEEARRIALKRKSEYERAREAMSSAEQEIENAKELGDISTAEELLKHAKVEFESGNYAQSISYAEEVKNKLKQLFKPEIEVEFPEKTFKLNYWETVSLVVRNKGNAHAKGVKIEFSDEFDVKGIREIEVNAGEEKELSVILEPKEFGEVPLEIMNEV